MLESPLSPLSLTLRERVFDCWSHFLAGDLDRADHLLEVAERRAAIPTEKHVVRFHRRLLQGVRRPEGPGIGSLRESWQEFRDNGDSEQTLLCLSSIVQQLKQSGCPAPVREPLLAELVHLAKMHGSPHLERLRHQHAYLLFSLGKLQRARELVQETLVSASPATGTVRRSRILLRVIESYLGLGRGLEGLSTIGMNPLEVLEARLLVARASLRQGLHDQAESWTWEAHRIAQNYRLIPAELETQRLFAELELLRGRPEKCQEWLQQARLHTPRTGREAWQLNLLQARLQAAQGDLAAARRGVRRILPQLERLEEVRPLREAQLLDLSLQLAANPEETSPIEAGLGEVESWEEVTDRWRFLVLVLPYAEGPRLGHDLERLLERDRNLGDRRGHCLAEVYLAANERRIGQGERAERRMATLERPLGKDLPERSLERWRQFLEHPELTRTADPGVNHFRSRWAEALLPPREVDPADLHVDLERRRVRCRGREICFRRRPSRLALLAFLARNHPRGFTVPELVEQVWQRTSIAYETDRLVYVGVHRLRQDLGTEGEWVEEVEGRYRLAPDLRVELSPLPSARGEAEPIASV